MIRIIRSTLPSTELRRRLLNQSRMEACKLFRFGHIWFERPDLVIKRCDIDFFALILLKYDNFLNRKESTIYNRLYSLSFEKNKKHSQTEKFKPEINKNSEEIIRLMKEGNDYDKVDRWKTLYEFGVEKQIMRKHIEEKVREIKEEEELSTHPFKPQILPYDQEQSTDGPKDVVERTKAWAASMECKKEVVLESHLQNEMKKQIQECTFKPRLIAEEYLKQRNTTTSEMSKQADIELNSKGLEAFYRRMEEAHYRKKEDDDYKDNY